jgi:hypothetical protein
MTLHRITTKALLRSRAGRRHEAAPRRVPSDLGSVLGMESRQPDDRFSPRHTGTCPVWALGMWLSSGGEISRVWSSHYRWLPRWLWSPDGQTWFGYVPLQPVPPIPKDSPFLKRCWHNLKVFKHSLWFEGRVRQEKPRQEKTTS